MVKLPSVESKSSECHECGGCVGRREFFQTTLAAGLAGVALAFLPRSLAALPPSWIVGAERAGTFMYDVPATDGVHVDRKAEVIVVRHEGSLSAFALSCPHQRSLLRWRDKKGIFQCTKHHSEYTPEGVYIRGRATRNMDRLAVRLDAAGQLVVDPGIVFKSDEDPEGWAAAFVPIP
jgi:nitrite reductase/ring-hydroxylating ferredoxin subunit